MNKEMSKGVRTVIDCATYALNMLAQISDYSWSADFCKTEAQDAMKKVREKLRDIDFSTLSLEEARMLRFGMWTETTILCPLYVQPILKPHEGNDIRGGCISAGWEVIDGVIRWDENKDIFSDDEEKP